MYDSGDIEARLVLSSSQPKIEVDLGVIRRYALAEGRGLPVSVTIHPETAFLQQLYAWARPGGLLDRAREVGILTYGQHLTLSRMAQTCHRQPLIVREAYCRVMQRLAGYLYRSGLGTATPMPIRSALPSAPSSRAPAGAWGRFAD